LKKKCGSWVRKRHTAWSVFAACILSVFLSFHNPVFAEIKSVLLNPTENGKYTVVELSSIQNITYLPYSINKLGKIVGYSITFGGYYRAFL
jgi:hypothetical protein